MNRYRVFFVSGNSLVVLARSPGEVGHAVDPRAVVRAVNDTWVVSVAGEDVAVVTLEGPHG